MKKIIMIIMLLWAGKEINAQVSWRVVGRMLYPVSGGQVVYDLAGQSNKIYIFGGYSDSLQHAVDWIQEYDALPVTNNWHVVGNMQQSRQQFVADIWKNNALYFGGTSEIATDKTSLEAWEYNVVTNPPTLFDKKDNFGRSFSTGHVKGDNLYIIGGNPIVSGTTLPYIFEYNLNTKLAGFTFNSPSADPPRQHMTFLVGDNIYIFGGVTNGVMNSIQRFNIPTKKLETLSTKLIEARAGGAAVYNPSSKKGYIMGGYNETNPALATVEQIIVNSDGTLSVSSTTPLNYARSNLMAVNYKGTVAVFGGKDTKGKVVRYVEILLDQNTTGTGETQPAPTDYQLFQNYPNPFNPSTDISYQLPASGFVSLKVFDFLGREISTLVNETQQPGIHHSKFNTQNYNLPSGTYFYKLSVGNYLSTKKMLLLK